MTFYPVTWQLMLTMSPLLVLLAIFGGATYWLVGENRRLREDLAAKNETIDDLNAALAGADSRRSGWDVL